MKSALLLALCVGGLSAMPAFAQAPKPDTTENTLIGDWRGDSICVVRPSACQDEQALYKIAKAGTSPNHFSLEAYKIVKGKPEYMGPAECDYFPEKLSLNCTRPNLALNLTLVGKTLNGTMTLPDGTVWRKVTLKHD